MHLPTNVFQQMQEFINANALKKAALSYIAVNASDKDISELKKLFQDIDKNGDGHITAAEVMEALNHMTVDPKLVESVVRLVDTNLSGAIDYTEFLATNIHTQLNINTGYLKNVFDFFDKDGNGVISTSELKDAFSFQMDGQKSSLIR